MLEKSKAIFGSCLSDQKTIKSVPESHLLITKIIFKNEFNCLQFIVFPRELVILEFYTALLYCGNFISLYKNFQPH